MSDVKIYFISVIALLLLVGESMAQVKSDSNALIINTNFTIPMVRFNQVINHSDKKGNVVMFRSVGAGFSLNFGSLLELRDTNSNLVNSDFYNKIGLQLGFLFSSSTEENQSNVFALNIALNILDIQFGYGHEYGTVQDDQRREFYTISYAIPLARLTQKGNYVIRRYKKNRKGTSKSEGYFL